jgi:hypothetical protein
MDVGDRVADKASLVSILNFARFPQKRILLIPRSRIRTRAWSSVIPVSNSGTLSFEFLTRLIVEYD